MRGVQPRSCEVRGSETRQCWWRHTVRNRARARTELQLVLCQRNASPRWTSCPCVHARHWRRLRPCFSLCLLHCVCFLTTLLAPTLLCVPVITAVLLAKETGASGNSRGNAHTARRNRLCVCNSRTSSSSPCTTARAGRSMPLGAGSKNESAEGVGAQRVGIASQNAGRL